MNFTSVLDRRARPDLEAEELAPPACLRDLNLDAVIAAIAAGRAEYRLEPFFYRPLDDADDIAYRREVMRDLEGPLAQKVHAFARAMQDVRRHLRGAAERHYRLTKQGMFLQAALIYGAAVRQLAAALGATEPRSRALLRFSDYLGRYVGASGFRALTRDAEAVEAGLTQIHYCTRIRGGAVTVSGYDGEADYSVEIEENFAKFRQGAVKDYAVRFPELTGANHIEAQVGEFVAKLNPEIFRKLDRFYSQHQHFIDPVISRFDREVQFYLAYLEHIGKISARGLPFCYPELSATSKAVSGTAVFDLALAAKLLGEGAEVVVNDFRLVGPERVLVISGPNQGGKTTFARVFGQLHYLALLGCPVPGTAARLLLCDHIFTHFEREERIEDLCGKLYDDVLRIRGILAEATPRSLIVMNEIFASTALEDAVSLATLVMRRVLARDCLCVCVTFLDEIARMDDAVVSMVSTVVPDNPAERTFKLVRRPADGRAYAMAIAEKYRLSQRAIRERLSR